eukprot:TRINITY_DN10183_c0_g3_i1.p1 TRINITY_DN10183_c0_g3~~TRINITY_DN10183_c0_g3_i1.p1  ORF type:complete len:167 (-),score=16.38 TRINITY_DN10183_c0_g3_i1:1278-1778(-)
MLPRRANQPNARTLGGALSSKGNQTHSGTDRPNSYMARDSISGKKKFNDLTKVNLLPQFSSAGKEVSYTVYGIQQHTETKECKKTQGRANQRPKLQIEHNRGSNKIKQAYSPGTGKQTHKLYQVKIFHYIAKLNPQQNDGPAHAHFYLSLCYLTKMMEKVIVCVKG